MGKKLQLSDAQRAEAVLALLSRSEKANVIARRYKISEGTLYRFRDEFIKGGKAAIAAKSAGKAAGKAELEGLKRDIADRDQIIVDLTVANRVLKKISDLSR